MRGTPIRRRFRRWSSAPEYCFGGGATIRGGPPTAGRRSPRSCGAWCRSPTGELAEGRRAHVTATTAVRLSASRSTLQTARCTSTSTSSATGCSPARPSGRSCPACSMGWMNRRHGRSHAAEAEGEPCEPRCGRSPPPDRDACRGVCHRLGTGDPPQCHVVDHPRAVLQRRHPHHRAAGADAHVPHERSRLRSP